MKKLLLATLVIACSASLAFAQPGSIGLFADPAGTDCNFVDGTPGLVLIYVVHVNHGGMVASQFKATMPACFTGASYLADGQVKSVTLGNSQTGVAIGYGGCDAAPTHILTIQVFAGGAAATCCYWGVTADPALPSGLIEMSDCNDDLHVIPRGGELVINPDMTCNCDVGAEASTWGKVKSLFE